MNITELTFHPCWTCAVLLEEALWDVEHNHCTYNRSDFAMMWSAGSCVAIKGANQPDETHFGCFPFVSHLLRCSLVWDSPPRPAPEDEDAPCGCGLFFLFFFTYNLSKPRQEATAGWSQRSVSCVSCVRDKLVMSTHVLVCIYSHTCTWSMFTHTHTHPVQTHHQWHEPSAVPVFRLHWAPSWCDASPTMVRTFIFPSPYSCSSLLFESFAPQFMHTQHVSPLYLHCKGKCNVGHQTQEPDWESAVVCERRGSLQSKRLMWKEGCKKKTQQRDKKKKRKKKKHNGTNKSFFDKLLKRRVRLFWVLSPVGWGAGIQKHCFLSLPLLPSHAPWWIVYATYLLLHLCCTFRPIIAPTWDCTQDNVGIFDNTDCETETLFWINKQRRLELLERNPRFFPPPRRSLYY